jgi:hypothetical protein
MRLGGSQGGQHLPQWLLGEEKGKGLVTSQGLVVQTVHPQGKSYQHEQKHGQPDSIFDRQQLSHVGVHFGCLCNGESDIDKYANFIYAICAALGYVERVRRRSGPILPHFALFDIL